MNFVNNIISVGRIARILIGIVLCLITSLSLADFNRSNCTVQISTDESFIMYINNQPFTVSQPFRTAFKP